MNRREKLDIFTLRASLPAAIRRYVVDTYLGPLDDGLITRVYSLLWCTRGFYVQFIDEKTYERLSHDLLRRWYTPFMQDAEFQAMRAQYLQQRVRPRGKGRLYDLQYRTARQEILDGFFAQQPFENSNHLQFNPTSTFPALQSALAKRRAIALFTSQERSCLEQFLQHCLVETTYFVRESLVPVLRSMLPRFEAERALRTLRLSDPARSEAFNKRLLRMDVEDLDAQVRAFNERVVRGTCPLATHPSLHTQVVPTVAAESL